MDKQQLTDIETPIKQCGSLRKFQLILVKVWFQVCDLDVTLVWIELVCLDFVRILYHYNMVTAIFVKIRFLQLQREFSQSGETLLTIDKL